MTSRIRKTLGHVNGASRTVPIVGDLLATGGTAAATVELVHAAGAWVVGVSFVIELTSLAGRHRLEPLDTFSVVQF